MKRGNIQSTHDRDKHYPRWFGQRRDHFLRRMMEDLFHFDRSFQQLYGVYLDCRKPEGPYGIVDLLTPETRKQRERMGELLTRMIGTETEKGRLWELKDLCHLIWPGHDLEQNIRGSLIDWLFGSVFHESMKLKENIYLLNTYGPTAIRMHRLPPVPSGQGRQSLKTLPRLSAMVDVEALIHRIASDVVRQIEQIAVLLGQANCTVRMMLPELAGNLLVVRLLVEKEETVRELWGEGIEALLSDMFAGSVARGFCAVGRSYLSGQWYPQALTMYKRALGSDPECNEARVKAAHIEAMLRENSRLRDWGVSKKVEQFN
ncbi:MAG TPA: hypothetical protein ENK96_07860 [Desulfobulbaceae bacterium]|nr:hypothetical protein [Desulfobulbaceae bacterium]